MALLILGEWVLFLLFLAFVGSQVVWPWATDQPLFPDIRPTIRRRRREEAALRAAERELAEIVEARRRVEVLGGRVSDEPERRTEQPARAARE